MLSHERNTAASPERVWELYASPELWKTWAPHVRSPQGLGEPEVRTGAHGSIRLGGAVPIPAEIVDVERPRMWSWKVGPVMLRHTVQPNARGSRIGIRVEAPAGLELAMRIGYMPLVRLLLANLARVAERSR